MVNGGVSGEIVEWVFGKGMSEIFFFDNIPKNPGCISETIFKNNFEECLEKYQDQFLEKNR